MKNRICKLLVTALTVIPVLAFSMTLGSVAAYADGTVSVYTGEPVDAFQAQFRPIAVMMPTDRAAQPSYGISHAKVLYEMMEEGSISRQLAIIDDWQSLERIGNIRSCREYYIHVATEWDPILIHYGGVVYMKNRITQPDIDNLSGTSEYGIGGKAPGSGYFYRSTDRKVPHNAYISAEGITAAANKLGYSLIVRPQYYQPAHFTFSPVVNTLELYPTALSANTVNLSKIFPYTKSAFVFNPMTGLYDKSIHGAAQVDGENGIQLSFSNVIIQFTNWEKKDSKGYLAFSMLGTGEGYYCTQGRAIHITWVKTDDHMPTKYYDDFGQEVLFNTGKTYIAIAQNGKLPVFE